MNTFSKALDTLLGHRYKVRLFLTAALLSLAVPAVAREATYVKGAALPAGVQQVGEDRYRSPSSYADTLAFYAKAYKGSPRKTIINQPGIRAVHIVNDGKGDWEGLNVYELDGETRIFIVPRDAGSKGQR